MDMDLLALLLFLLIIIGISGMAATRRQSKGSAEKTKPVTYTGANAAGQTAASTAKARATNPEQIVEDVKMTQTSRIVDAVQVLDELGATSPGYRHYCELIGKSQASGGVTAPYSGRQVAYYDLRCYRIEVRGGRDVETLVAREKSIEPFWFADGSGSEQVYVDLESFGEHCILVNATNRVEGPNSDFSKKFSSAMGAVDSKAATGVPGVMAAVRSVAARGENVARNVLGGMRASLRGWNAGMVPAYAGVSVGDASYVGHRVADGASSKGSNLQLAGRGGPMGGRPGGHGGPGMGGMGGPRPGGGRPGGRPGSSPYSSPYGMGGTGGLPRDLQVFLGGPNSGWMGGPRYRQSDVLEEAVGTLVGMGVGALIGSLSTQSSSSSGYGAATNVESVNGFRGYRIIEDVVPLGSPIYALGEIYRNGSDVHVSRSVSSSYPSSYFATKPEAEVIAALS